MATQAVSLWESVSSIANDWDNWDAIRAHGMQLLVAQARRAQGRPVPLDILRDEQSAVMMALAVPSELRRIRSFLEGPVILVKGPDLAWRYPDPELRPYGDLDLIVPDAPATQLSLINHGYHPVFDEDRWAVDHHLPTLRHPRLPLMIEVHSQPKWVSWHHPPAGEELFATAVPSPLGIDGISSIEPTRYALLLATHAWAHGPLSRLLHLIDFAVVSAACDQQDLHALASDWQLDAVLRTTEEAIDAVFSDVPVRNPVVRRWVDQLQRGQERAAIEHFAALWLGGLWAPTPHQRVGAIAQAIRQQVRPFDGANAVDYARRLAYRARRILRPTSQYYD